MEEFKNMLEILASTITKEPLLAIALMCLGLAGLAIYAVIVVAQSFAKSRG